MLKLRRKGGIWITVRLLRPSEPQSVEPRKRLSGPVPSAEEYLGRIDDPVGSRYPNNLRVWESSALILLFRSRIPVPRVRRSILRFHRENLDLHFAQNAKHSQHRRERFRVVPTVVGNFHVAGPHGAAAERGV